MKFNEFLTRVVNDCINSAPEPDEEHSGAHACPECEGEDGAHEPGCRESPDWEPSEGLDPPTPTPASSPKSWTSAPTRCSTPDPEEPSMTRDRRCDAHIIRNAYLAVSGEPKPLALAAIDDAWDLADAAGYTDSSCEECGAEEGKEHEEDCRCDPDWEPSDDDLDLSGEGVAAAGEAERRSLRDAGRDRGGVW